MCAQYNCEATFVGIDSEVLCSQEPYSVIYITKEDLGILSEYDYVIACLGGYLLNCTIAMLKDTDTKVISIFPGIVSHYQLDAFISRLNADQVWLNSKADSELYSKLCRLLKCSNNSILYGMSWLDLEQATDRNAFTIKSNKAIIFEQTEILSDSNSRKRFLKILEKIIVLNPEINFKYKVRNNSLDHYFLQLRKSLDQFKNVDVVCELDHYDIAQASYYLSLSSSALIEGIAYGKSSYIMDEGLLDCDSREFYSNSNIELTSLELKNVCMSMNQYWYNQRVSLPIINVNFLSIHKKNIYVVFKSRSYSLIRLMLLKLTFFYPKTAYLFVNKPKIVAIQKSLEYLSM
ncbi:MAG: hypothetical protein N2B06_10845 [Clostridium sp.]